MQTTIRDIAEDDLEAVVTIMNQAIEERKNAFTTVLSGAQARRWFEQTRHTTHAFIGVEEDGTLVGWGTIMPYREGRGALASAAEISFYIERQARRKGVGTALIEHLEGKAKAQGLRSLFGIMLDDNESSKRLMMKLNYTIWAHLPQIAYFTDKTVGQCYLGKKL